MTTAVFLGLATASARPAVAQDVPPDPCRCNQAAESDDGDRKLPWWLFGVFIGSGIGWGQARPPAGPGQLGATPAASTPPASPATPARALTPGGAPEAGIPALAAAPPGPRGVRGAGGAGPDTRGRALVAPNTATNRPTIAAAGIVLLLLGAAHRRARRRAEALAAAAAARARTASPPRVLLPPPRASEAPPGPFAGWRAAGLGRASTAAGVLCLVGVALSFARGAVASWEVRSNWAAPSAAAAFVPPGGLEIAAVAKLEIPAIGFSRLVGDGVDDRTLAAGPGHMPKTVVPGLTGLSVISAHRDLDFRRLGTLNVGDTVVTTTRTHRTVWRVTDRTVVPKDSAALIIDADRARLALTTCWPIRYFGSAPERLLVFAEPVRQELAPAEPVRVATR